MICNREGEVRQLKNSFRREETTCGDDAKIPRDADGKSFGILRLTQKIKYQSFAF